MDDIDLIRRKRAIKVIVSDLIMAVSVVAIVAILTAVVNGWRINSDFTVEQNGLISIRTQPTGATVFIDGKKQNQTTNFSKLFSEGKHKVTIEKTGYERWEKEVKVTPGWLLRLEYPRLFKQNREKKEVKTFNDLDFFNVSPDRSVALLSENNNWILAENFNSDPTFKTLDLKSIFKNPATNLAKDILSISWSKTNEKVLIETTNHEWIIIDLKNPNSSLNLTLSYHRFSHNSSTILASDQNSNPIFTSVKFENEAGNRLLAINSNNLLRLDLEAKTSTLAIDDHLNNFEVMESWLLYSTPYEDGRSLIKLLRFGDQSPTIVATNTDKNAILSFNLTRYNSEYFLLYSINHQLKVFKSTNLPTGGGSKLEMDLSFEDNIGILPSETKTSFSGEFISLREGARVVIFDAELEAWHEYDYGDEKIRFLDPYLLYRVDNASGKFLTWDFDGTNVRTLALNNVSNDFDALISPNGKHLYYFIKNTVSNSDNTTEANNSEASFTFTFVKESL